MCYVVSSVHVYTMMKFDSSLVTYTHHKGSSSGLGALLKDTKIYGWGINPMNSGPKSAVLPLHPSHLYMYVSQEMLAIVSI